MTRDLPHGGTAGLAAESCRGLSAAPKVSADRVRGPRGRRGRFRRRRRWVRTGGTDRAPLRYEGPHGGKGRRVPRGRPLRTGGRGGLEEDYSWRAGSWRPLREKFSLGITALTVRVQCLTRLPRLITVSDPPDRHAESTSRRHGKAPRGAWPGPGAGPADISVVTDSRARESCRIRDTPNSDLARSRRDGQFREHRARLVLDRRALERRQGQRRALLDPPLHRVQRPGLDDHLL